MNWVKITLFFFFFTVKPHSIELYQKKKTEIRDTIIHESKYRKEGTKVIFNPLQLIHSVQDINGADYQNLTIRFKFNLFFSILMTYS